MNFECVRIIEQLYRIKLKLEFSLFVYCMGVLFINEKVYVLQFRQEMEGGIVERERILGKSQVESLGSSEEIEV